MVRARRKSSLRFGHLHLENWRNFIGVDVKLQERAFLIGPNAYGKSNFLDVFRFLNDLAMDEINAKSACEKSIIILTDHSRCLGGGTWGRRKVAPAFCPVSVEAVDCGDHVRRKIHKGRIQARPAPHGVGTAPGRDP